MESARPPAVSPLPVEDLSHVLAKTAGLWDELRGKRIFITGGTGFFGLWLLESFAHANEKLNLQARAVVLTRDPAAFAAKAPHLGERADIEYVAGDVRDFRFPDGTFSHVIHAGTTSSAPVEPREMFETITDGTRRVLDFASTHGTDKFLFVSSGAVYGRQPADLTHVPEDYSGAPNSLEPSSAYGEGKRAAELLCVLAGQKQGFEIKIARCFAFVGPHLPLDAHFAIGNFIRDTLRGDSINIKGDGTPYRSYLYAADLAIWLWTALFRGKPNRAYNLGSENEITIRDLADLVARKTKSPLAVNLALQPDPARRIERYVPCTRAAREDLGVSETISLPEALDRTFAWHRQRM